MPTFWITRIITDGHAQPPHPCEFIQQIYLEPNELSARELSSWLGVAASTLNRILKGSSGISPEMALRLSKALGPSPES